MRILPGLCAHARMGVHEMPGDNWKKDIDNQLHPNPQDNPVSTILQTSKTRMICSQSRKMNPTSGNGIRTKNPIRYGGQHHRMSANSCFRSTNAPSSTFSRIIRWNYQTNNAQSLQRKIHIGDNSLQTDSAGNNYGGNHPAIFYFIEPREPFFWSLSAVLM